MHVGRNIGTENKTLCFWLLLRILHTQDLKNIRQNTSCEDESGHNLAIGTNCSMGDVNKTGVVKLSFVWSIYRIEGSLKGLVCALSNSSPVTDRGKLTILWWNSEHTTSKWITLPHSAATTTYQQVKSAILITNVVNKIGKTKF